MHWLALALQIQEQLEKRSRQNKCIWIDLYLFRLPLSPLNNNNIEVKSGQVSQFEDEIGVGKAEEQCHIHNVTLSLSRMSHWAGPRRPLPACQIVIYIPLLFLFCWWELGDKDLSCSDFKSMFLHYSYHYLKLNLFGRWINDFSPILMTIPNSTGPI